MEYGSSGPARRGAPPHELRQSFNEMLEYFWEKIGKHHTGVSGRAYRDVPAEADLSTGIEGLRIEVDLPGMDEADIEVSVSDRVLTIAGEKCVEREIPGRTYLISERCHGRFARSFHLPESIDVDRLAASYGKGVLSVTAPLKEGAAPQKKIEIKPG